MSKKRGTLTRGQTVKTGEAYANHAMDITGASVKKIGRVLVEVRKNTFNAGL